MKSLLAALLVSAALASGASAATTIFTDSVAFSGASSALQTEDFENNAIGSINPTRDFDGFTTNLTSSIGGPFNRVRDGGVVNVAGLSGRNLHVGLIGGETLTLNFGTAYSFGALFAGVNNGVLGAARSTISVNFVGGGSSVFDADSGWLAKSNDLAARFWGFVSTSPFSSVTFTGLQRSEGFGMDNVQWASAPPPTPVPVPASGLLLMGAMMVAGFVARRRARA